MPTFDAWDVEVSDLAAAGFTTADRIQVRTRIRAILAAAAT
jgi:hypothetical protein